MRQATHRVALAQLRSWLWGFLLDATQPFGSVLTVQEVQERIARHVGDRDDRVAQSVTRVIGDLDPAPETFHGRNRAVLERLGAALSATLLNRVAITLVEVLLLLVGGLLLRRGGTLRQANRPAPAEREVAVGFQGKSGAARWRTSKTTA